MSSLYRSLLVDTEERKARATNDLRPVLQPSIVESSTVEPSTVEPRRYPIRNAQDVLNPYEEALYDALWGLPRKSEGESYRICRKGYTELARTAKLSRRAVQDMIPRLASKGFLTVESEYVKRSTYAYRVRSYAAVREHQRERGWTHWIKEGRGRSYASTVEQSIVEASTVRQSSTVAPDQSSTVAPGATLSSEGNTEGNSSSSSSIADTIYRLTGEYPDDDAVSQIRAACRAQWPAIPEAEIAGLVEAKMRTRPHIKQSVMGFLISAVPKMRRT